MIDLMGIINLNEAEEHIGELSRSRSLASIPFAGRYRLIDFVLSNMVNSEISNVGIFIQHKYRSLVDHLRSGKDWDLARKRDGLFVLPPAYTRTPMQVHRGDVENLYSNLDYIYQSRQRYVIIAGANIVSNMDYRGILEYHKNTEADITVLYTKANCGTHDCVRSNILGLGPEGRVLSISEFKDTGGYQNMSIDMFIMKKDLLIELVNGCIARGDYDFVKHCIIKNVKRLKVYGYHHPGYVARISSLQSYFQHSMELLNPHIWKELFFKSGLIYTKVKDEAPAKYIHETEVTNSLIASGCYVEGKVENSILFRGVKVHKGAYIKNSVIMQKGNIGSGVILENVICDKDVHITANKQLKGEYSYPLVIKKGRVI
ncbi:glucose-1-phosphate adenylyltransferase subunit GlgD [Pelosinus propionicus]|uniref:Glucose-1-phosphate adenylyltransferase n=1 Tax=Pelosinus propionicus DSM 13327 TaxID=1123291 RepID=A0A1I4NN64_9FIRM|nr:glucose-1-phosphate adenylyltransferase subunit GlgD [Pelosinus propionicus]SFM16770.1 glucose-1-phosphate adenylyltransferase [Pelosinus propionicus DSM 13327]